MRERVPTETIENCREIVSGRRRCGSAFDGDGQLGLESSCTEFPGSLTEFGQEYSTWVDIQSYAQVSYWQLPGKVRATKYKIGQVKGKRV